MILIKLVYIYATQLAVPVGLDFLLLKLFTNIEIIFRGILFDSEHSVQARGIVVLLLSKLLLQNLKFKAQLDMTKTIKL